MFDKALIKSTLKRVHQDLGLTQGTLCITAGGALVMYGIRERTGDLDLLIDPEAFVRLSRGKVLVHTNMGPIWSPEEGVDLHSFDMSAFPRREIEGVSVPTLEEVLVLKQQLLTLKGRGPEKIAQDKKDIKAIEELMAKEK